jgi:polyphosphate kinase 2 (PPK2 family)
MAINLSAFEAGTPFRGDYEKTLDELQQRLSRAFVAHIVHGRSSVIVFEGWDTAGKGGIIQRLTAKGDPRALRVWPIDAPTAEERGRHFLWRFWTRLPAPGEIAIFDRSWYGRVLVERVEALATQTEWFRAYDEINEFEAQLVDHGTTVVKLFLHITQAVQDERLRARLEHPWKRWKVSTEDFRNRDRRASYVAAVEEMFSNTDTRWAPWHVIDANDKKAARIAALSTVANALERAVPMDPPPLRADVEALARDRLGISA